jgi:hypothetical protein
MIMMNAILIKAKLMSAISMEAEEFSLTRKILHIQPPTKFIKPMNIPFVLRKEARLIV